jgi:pyrimidine operon attenuation protein / uracil phosphoribosyltransferase
MPSTKTPLQLMSGSEVDRTIVRLAHEILERTADLHALVFAGIRRRGIPLAERLSRKIEELEGIRVPVGVLDITMYRDDLSQVAQQPVVNNTDISVPIADKDVLIVDDVLFTGRTVRAAMDALFDVGRPSRVQLLVLIDRGHRELPIEARYIGRTVTTTLAQIIEVKFHEVDGADKVLLVEREEA